MFKAGSNFNAHRFESYEFAKCRPTHKLPSPMHRYRLVTFLVRFLFVFLLVAAVGLVRGDQRGDYSTNADSSLSYDLRTDENQSSVNQSNSNDSRPSGPYSENWSSNQPDESEQLNESELLDQLDLTDQLEQLNQLDIDLEGGTARSSRLAEQSKAFPRYQADQASRPANGKPPEKIGDGRSQTDKAGVIQDPNQHDKAGMIQDPNQQDGKRKAKRNSMLQSASERHSTERQAEQPLLDEPKQSRGVQKIPIGKRNLFSHFWFCALL